jgi:hypothetical protein
MNLIEALEVIENELTYVDLHIEEGERRYAFAHMRKARSMVMTLIEKLNDMGEPSEE